MRLFNSVGNPNKLVYPTYVMRLTYVKFNKFLLFQVVVQLNQYEFREAKTLWFDLMPEAPIN